MKDCDASADTLLHISRISRSQMHPQVSDSSGFGSGGTSVAATVQSSSDASCFNASAQVEPDFSFSIVPSNQIVECSPTRIWWDPSLVQGYVAARA